MKKQLSKVKAIFLPSKDHKNTLKEEYKQFIGKEFIFQYQYIMGKDDPFPGIWALMPMPNKENFVVGWVPEFDLKIIKQKTI